MRTMLRALGCKLGILHSSGTLEISASGDNPEGAFSIGSPYFHLTENGVEGPFYPSIWEDLGWVLKVTSPQPCGETGSASLEGENSTPDKAEAQV